MAWQGGTFFSDAISNVYTPVIGTTQGCWTSNQEVTVLLVRDLVRRANRASVSLSYFYRGVLFCYDDKQHLVGWYVGAITHCQGPLRRRLCSRIQFSHRPVIKWGVFFLFGFLLRSSETLLTYSSFSIKSINEHRQDLETVAEDWLQNDRLCKLLILEQNLWMLLRRNAAENDQLLDGLMLRSNTTAFFVSRIC